MDIMEKIMKLVNKDVDYDELYEKNIADQNFVIKFKSDEDAEAAMDDCMDLDSETGILSFIQDGKTLHVMTDVDIFVELIDGNKVSSDDVLMFYAGIAVIAYNHNCILLDIISHGVITRK